jgi:hypothetical protein
VLQCPDGRYCCDGNRSFNCCAVATAEFFDLPSATPIASIISASIPASAQSISGDQQPAEILSAANSSLSIPEQTRTRAFDPFSTSHYDPDNLDDNGRPHNWSRWRDQLSNGQKLGLILGVIVGVLAGMLLMCACHFLWRRYKKYRQDSRAESYPSSLNASKRHPDHEKTFWNLFPLTLWRSRGTRATMANRDQQAAPSELPANPLSVVPGCVELGSEDEITVNDSLQDVAASGSVHVTSAPSLPLSPLSPMSNTSINTVRTRLGSQGTARNAPVSPNSCSTCQDDAPNVEHAIYAVGSRGQLVSHSSRRSIPRVLDQNATPQDQNGLQSNVSNMKSEITKESEVQAEQNISDDVSQKVYREEEMTFELPG